MESSAPQDKTDQPKFDQFDRSLLRDDRKNLRSAPPKGEPKGKRQRQTESGVASASQRSNSTGSVGRASSGSQRWKPTLRPTSAITKQPPKPKPQLRPSRWLRPSASREDDRDFGERRPTPPNWYRPPRPQEEIPPHWSDDEEPWAVTRAKAANAEAAREVARLAAVAADREVEQARSRAAAAAAARQTSGVASASQRSLSKSQHKIARPISNEPGVARAKPKAKQPGRVAHDDPWVITQPTGEQYHEDDPWHTQARKNWPDLT